MRCWLPCPPPCSVAVELNQTIVMAMSDLQRLVEYAVESDALLTSIDIAIIVAAVSLFFVIYCLYSALGPALRDDKQISAPTVDPLSVTGKTDFETQMLDAQCRFDALRSAVAAVSLRIRAAFANANASFEGQKSVADVATEQETNARIDGDEFAIVLSPLLAGVDHLVLISNRSHNHLTAANERIRHLTTMTSADDAAAAEAPTTVQPRLESWSALNGRLSAVKRLQSEHRRIVELNEKTSAALRRARLQQRAAIKTIQSRLRPRANSHTQHKLPTTEDAAVTVNAPTEFLDSAAVLSSRRHSVPDLPTLEYTVDDDLLERLMKEQSRSAQLTSLLKETRNELRCAMEKDERNEQSVTQLRAIIETLQRTVDTQRNESVSKEDDVQLALMEYYERRSTQTTEPNTRNSTPFADESKENVTSGAEFEAEERVYESDNAADLSSHQNKSLISALTHPSSLDHSAAEDSLFVVAKSCLSDEHRTIERLRDEVAIRSDELSSCHQRIAAMIEQVHSLQQMVAAMQTAQIPPPMPSPILLTPLSSAASSMQNDNSAALLVRKYGGQSHIITHRRLLSESGAPASPHSSVDAHSPALSVVSTPARADSNLEFGPLRTVTLTGGASLSLLHSLSPPSAIIQTLQAAIRLKTPTMTARAASSPSRSPPPIITTFASAQMKQAQAAARRRQADANDDQADDAM